MAKGGKIRIGISGWTYAPWRGAFYPEGLAHKRELNYAAERFSSIEINGTFYRLQRPESFTRWAENTPDDFVFAVKAPRYITHMRRLKNIEKPVANFLASGVLKLGPKLGPILWQFPARMKFDPGTFEAFLALLPRNTEDAAALARHHDRRLKGRNWTKTDAKRPLRHAVEVRSDSFCTPEFIKLLRRYKVALVCADTVEWPRLMDITSDFVYCRLHGSEELYASGYGDKDLRNWARRVKAWARGSEPADATRVVKASKPRKTGRDVFVYFDNDMKVRAPVDAASLANRVGIAPKSRRSFKT
ncbi:protein of unknown function DUF72 [Parvibaculum lavamentivorans DS-1]|uniref:DUF72 domain-containing protein n=1 Tax=Parvibaculum lavamentivorans (strain DS-1 / DSM 13023 / NCIMB 13966) TaxID=402881 RepID=A7HXS9_PARL1|nr:DUF72 domain-containing protein [Parvibaculum lavamentivorans]ABS64712.1 protein of unknown function DUF72 [Parvibaculum lavamentivorans DS-1]